MKPAVALVGIALVAGAAWWLWPSREGASQSSQESSARSDGAGEEGSPSVAGGKRTPSPGLAAPVRLHARSGESAATGEADSARHEGDTGEVDAPPARQFEADPREPAWASPREADL